MSVLLTNLENPVISGIKMSMGWATELACVGMYLFLLAMSLTITQFNDIKLDFRINVIVIPNL
jgi:hypothetical protein